MHAGCEINVLQQIVSFLSDEGPLFETLNLAFRISAVHQPFIFIFVFQHCLRNTQRLLHYLTSRFAAWSHPLRT